MDALKKVNQDRKCFRLVGGVLVERTVRDVLPALQYNSQQVAMLLIHLYQLHPFHSFILQLTGLLSKLETQLTEKGKELNAFKLKHGIQIQEEKEAADNKDRTSTDTKSSQGVLISK